MKKFALIALLSLAFCCVSAIGFTACDPVENKDPAVTDQTGDNQTGNDQTGDNNNDDGNNDQTGDDNQEGGHVHALTPHEANEATCRAQGNTAYYSCGCGKFFSDDKGEHEITENSWITAVKEHVLGEHAANEATCEEGGNLAYWLCSSCNGYFKDAEGAEEYEPDGWITQAKGHTPGELQERVDPGCGSAGHVAYYQCADCEKYFSDPDAETEIPADEIELSATGAHQTYSWQDIPAADGEGGKFAYACTECQTVKAASGDEVYCYEYDKQCKFSEYTSNDFVVVKNGNFLLTNDTMKNGYITFRMPVKEKGTYSLEFTVLPCLTEEGATGSEKPTAKFKSDGASLNEWNNSYYTGSSWLAYTEHVLGVKSGIKYNVTLEGEAEPAVETNPNYNRNLYVTKMSVDITDDADIGKNIKFSTYVTDKGLNVNDLSCTYRVLVKAVSPESERDLSTDWELASTPTDMSKGRIQRRDADGFYTTEYLPKITEEGYTVTPVSPATRTDKGVDHYAIDVNEGHFEFDYKYDFNTDFVLGEEGNVVEIFQKSGETTKEATKDIFYLRGITSGKKYVFRISNDSEMGEMVIYNRTGKSPYTYTEFYNSSTAASRNAIYTADSTSAVFVFLCENTGKFSITIIETEDPDYGKLAEGKEAPLSLADKEGSIDIEMASTFEEGWYKLSVKGGTAKLGRAYLELAVNGVGAIKLNAGAAGTGNVEEDFAVILYLTSSDVLTYTNKGLEPLETAVTVTKHESHAGAGEWTVTTPTQDEGGLAIRTCEGKVREVVVLPALSQAEKYSTQSVDGGTKYTITVGGLEIDFTVAPAE